MAGFTHNLLPDDGSLHFSMQLEGYPDQGETNALLERLKGKKIRLMVEEVQP